MAELYEVRLTTDKGYGVFATSDIEAGTVILTDTKIMCIREEWKGDVQPHHVFDAFNRLSELDMCRYLDLFACSSRSEGQSLVCRIYSTNCFNDDHTNYICLTISRINHACTPNAMCFGNGSKEDVVRAIAPIPAGEEISISYRQDICWLLQRPQRQNLLQTWGFACRCSTCHRTKHEIDLSDARRKTIWGLLWRTKFAAPVDYSHFDHQNHRVAEKAYDRVSEPATRALHAIETRMAYHLLLAQCLEVESTERDMIANTYASAAEAQLVKIKQTEDDVIVLQYALNVRNWMLKAIHHTAGFYGRKSSWTQKRENEWKTWQLVPQLKLALHIADLVLLHELPTRPLTVMELCLGHWRSTGLAIVENCEDVLPAAKAFALRFIYLPNKKAAIKCINRRELREVFRKQGMSSKTRARAGSAMKEVMEEYRVVVQLKEKGGRFEDNTADLNLLMMESLPGHCE